MVRRWYEDGTGKNRVCIGTAGAMRRGRNAGVLDAMRGFGATQSFRGRCGVLRRDAARHVATKTVGAPSAGYTVSA